LLAETSALTVEATATLSVILQIIYNELAKMADHK